MTIPESQLGTWSHQGATTASRLTYTSLVNCLEQYDFPENIKYTHYLQGSYRNSTNIFGNSDVSVVIELESSGRPNTEKLSKEEKKIFDNKYHNVTYNWKDFRDDVLQALSDYYETDKITEGNKSIKLESNSGRLNADILVAIKYRYFFHVYENGTDDYVEGIAFYARNGKRWMYSYPQQHYDNGVKKMQDTNQCYKSLIRIYKNLEAKLIDNTDIPDSFISSQYVESLLYNLPNHIFSGSYSDMMHNSFSWFLDNEFDDFKFQHNLFNLFGEGIDQWSISEANAFISALIKYLNEW